MVAATLKRAGFGFLLGIVSGVFIVIGLSFASGGSITLPQRLLAMTGSEAGALLAQVLISGVYGAIPMAGVTFYELDSWGLLKQAVVHYASYTAAFLLVGYAIGWVETVSGMALVTAIFAVGHAIIWAIMYIRYKAATQELNELLQKAKRVNQPA
jgi:tryptophan synthase alpha subunit